MRVKIELDAKREHPRVTLEAESEAEETSLQLLSGFKTATFCVLLDEDEEEVTV